MQNVIYQALAIFLLLLHPLCYLLSYLLFDLCEFKTPKLKKKLMLRSVIAIVVINTALILLCPALLFPGRGLGGILTDVLGGVFSYRDMTRLALSAFLCLLLSGVLTVLCCVLYRRFRDDRLDTTPQQRSLLLCVLAAALVPVIAGVIIGGSGADNLRVSGVCRRFEVTETSEITGEEFTDYYGSVTLRNDGTLKCETGSLYLSVEADDLRQVALPPATLLPGAEYTLTLPDDESLQIKKAGGSTVYLSNEWGRVLDQVTVPALEKGEKYSMTGADWSVIPAPIMEIAEEPVVTVPTPVFSAESGFYDEPFDLTLSAAPGLKIYYTLDCSEPDENAASYEAPINIYDKSREPNQLRTRKDIRFDYLEEKYTNSPVKKAMIVRAVSIDTEGNRSPVSTQCYFIGNKNDGLEGRNVLSVVSDPDSFSGPTGILVTGPEFDAWYQEAYANTPEGERVDRTDQPITNVRQQGIEWEREAEILFFSDGELIYQEDAGVRAQGEVSRDYANKRLSIYAREQYCGSDYFPVSLINQAKQHSLVIRGDSDMHALIHRLCAGRDVLTADFVPTAFYINGERFYDGFLFEKFDEKNIGDKYGYSAENIVLVKNGEIPENADSGSVPYSRILGFCTNNDMSSAEKYETYQGIIDIQSYIDTLCINVYMANMDIQELGHNFLSYHTIIPEKQGWGDTLWRFGLIDMDLLWPLAVNADGKNAPWEINGFTEDSIWSIPINQYTIYTALKVNPVFFRQFVLSFMDMVNTTFSPENTTAVMDELNITNEQYRTFFEKRPEYAVPHLAEEFGLTGTLEAVALSSNRPGAPVTLNTVTPELKDGLWSGSYFTDYPVTVTANGDGFDHWEVTSLGVKKTYDDVSIDVPVTKGGVQIHAVYQ